MDLLIRNAQIVAPGEDLHGEEKDILIREGYIAAIGERLPSAPGVEELSYKGQCASIGWVDIGAQVGDPGLEHRETLHTAGAAAAAGGFTAVAALPNTQPVIDDKSGVQYISKNAYGKLVQFLPIGAITQGCKGVDITEMIDMQRAGAVAFSDGEKPLQHTGVMLRALEYVKAFGGLVINQPLDKLVSHGGQVHEGRVSTAMGLAGLPAIAEEIMVRRDLHLLEYAESRLHLANLSTAGAVQMVREAKSRGLQVTASVGIMNLVYDEEAVADFDSNFKVMPPLRSAEDRAALAAGVKDGTIDIISAHHVPLEEEVKKLEFSYADFGVTGLETLYALSRTFLSDWLEAETLVQALAYNPRKLFGLPIPHIAVGQPAELTIFHPDMAWAYERGKVQSRSLNSPVLGQTLNGRVLGVVNNNQFFSVLA